MTVEKTDMVLPGPFPITIGRKYNPFDPFGRIAGFQAALGVGWALSVDIILMPINADLQRLILPGNARLDLVRQPDGTFRNSTHPMLSGAVLSTLPGGEHQLRFRDGTTWRFRSLFLGLEFLVEMADRNGNRVTIERYSGGKISQIVDATGRTLSIFYAGSQISQIVDPIGRTVQYSYDLSGRLATVTDPQGGVTRYTYDAEGRILTITDARNIRFVENFYGPSGRVLRQAQADGGEWRFRFLLSGATVQGPGCPGFSCPTEEDSWENAQAGYNIQGGLILATIVVDPRGHSTTYRFNNIGFLIEQIDPQGQSTLLVRDATNQLTSTTDPLGRKKTTTYDAAGNATSITDPDGNITRYEYEPQFNRVIKITDPLGRVTQFTYDPKGNLIATIDPLLNTTTLAYNPFGQPVTVTDPLANITQFEYDASGNLIATTDPLGNKTARLYDSVSRLAAIADPRGFITSFTYDPLNRVTQITDAIGGLTKFTYDPNGNLLTVTDARTKPQHIPMTAWTGLLPGQILF